MLAFVIQNHAHRSGTHLGRKPVRRLAHDGSTFSRFGTSGKPGAVQVAAGCWAKLAFEFSPAGRPPIVSVVTKDTSDDAHGPDIDAQQVYLRVYWDGTVFAFHYSLDGKSWSLVRLFALAVGECTPTIELTAQSPIGEGCLVSFGDVYWKAETLSDLRDGS